ncbi:MAG: hypothetical protein LBJ73_05295 [Rickettsiales bacterium]|jgi:hypothetical protein|nr:hypothetical protein [Rickettsiales bacterium]
MKKSFCLLLSVFCLCFSMGGCGFSPMYSAQKADVYVAAISGTNGIDLRNALNAKFGGAVDANAKYKLTVELAEPITTYKAIQSTGDATWQEVRLSAAYTLADGDKTIASGRENAAESYTFVRYLVAANASYNNAVQNSITVLADKIGMRVIAETAD